MRLIEIIKNVPQHLLTARNVMALMQGLPTEEMGYTPLVKGTKESIRAKPTKHHNVLEPRLPAPYKLAPATCSNFVVGAKGAAVLFDWISGRRLDHIEAEFSTNAYFGRIEYGDVRRFADTSTTPTTLIMISVADAGWFDKAFS